MEATVLAASAFNQENIFYQEFPFPSSIMYYLKNFNFCHPGYLQLVKCCKYFYSKKNFVVPFYNTCFYKSETGKQMCGVKTFNGEKITLLFEDNNFNVSLTGYLLIYGLNLGSKFFSKIHKCDVFYININYGTILLDDLLMITKKISSIEMHKTIVKYRNNTIVPIDCIFASLPETIISFNYESVRYFSEAVNYNALCNLADLIRSSKTLIYFCFRRVHRNFEFEPFFNLVKDRPEIRYLFDYRGPLLKSKKKQLRKYVRETIEIGITEFCPPYIMYSGQKKREEKTLNELIDACSKKRKIQQFFNVFEDTLF